MKLINATLTTGVIIALVWTTAVLQPNTAIANDRIEITTGKYAAVQPQINANEPSTKKKAAMKAAKISDFSVQQLAIHGLNQTSLLSNVNQLWQDFQMEQSYHSGLTHQPKRIYVLYRHFSADYGMADITIGYDVSTLVGHRDGVAVPEKAYQQVLNKQQYSNTQLQQGWKKLDYRKAPKVVLEVHHLRPDNQVSATEMFVAYQ